MKSILFLILVFVTLNAFAADKDCNAFFKSPLMTKYFENHVIEKGENAVLKDKLPEVNGLKQTEIKQINEQLEELATKLSKETIQEIFEAQSLKALTSKTVAAKISERIEDIVVRYYQKNSDRPTASYISTKLGFRSPKAKSYLHEITQSSPQFDYYLAGLLTSNEITKLQIKKELVDGLVDYTKKFKQFPNKTTLIQYLSNILKKDPKFLKQLYPFLGNNNTEFGPELVQVYLENLDALLKSGLDDVINNDVNFVITEFLLSKKRLPEIIELESRASFPREILEVQFKKIYDGRVLLEKELLSIVIDNPEVQNFARQKLVSALNKHFSNSYKFPVGDEFTALADLALIDRGLMSTYFPQSSSVDKTTGLIFDILHQEQALFQKFRESIMKKYAKASEGKHILITEDELARELNISVDELERFYLGKKNGVPFENMQALYHEARALFPKEFSKVKDTFHFTEARVEKIFTASRDARNLLFTAAMAGAEIPADKLAAMKTVREYFNAAGFIHGVEQEVTHLDPKAFELEADNIFVAPPESILHDESIAVDDIGLTGKQINPFSGIKHRGPFGGIVVYPNPKIEGETIRTLAESSHQIFTTGIISGDNWFTDNLTKSATQIRTNMFAQEDSGVPALLLIQKDDTIARETGQGAYSTPIPRYILWDEELGGFVDENLIFYPDGRIEEREVEAMILGDTHGTHASEQHLPAIKEHIQKYKPVMVVGNDGIEGASANHHVFDSDYYLNQMLESGELDVRAEHAKYISLVDEIIRIGIEAHGENFVYYETPGNHNKWYTYLITKGWYKKHGALYDDIVKVIQSGLDAGYDPMEFMSKYSAEFGFHTTAYPNNLVFLKNGEDLVINNGKQGAARKTVAIHHGDMGMSKGSKRTSYESLVTGHNHAKFTFKYTKRGFQMGVGAITVDHTYFAGSASNVGMSFGIVSRTLMPQLLQSEGLLSPHFALPENLRFLELDDKAKSSEYPQFYSPHQRNQSHDLHNGGGADSVTRILKDE